MTHASRLLITATLLVTTAPALAADPPTSCSLATLRGTMVYAATGSNGGVANAGSGMESYDGAGHFKWLELWSDGSVAYRWHGVGTYAISANGIATVIYDGNTSMPWTDCVPPDGSACYWNNNGLYGEVASGRADRITKAHLLE